MFFHSSTLKWSCSNWKPGLGKPSSYAWLTQKTASRSVDHTGVQWRRSEGGFFHNEMDCVLQNVSKLSSLRCLVNADLGFRRKKSHFLSALGFSLPNWHKLGHLWVAFQLYFILIFQPAWKSWANIDSRLAAFVDPTVFEMASMVNCGSIFSVAPKLCQFSGSAVEVDF